MRGPAPAGGGSGSAAGTFLDQIMTPANLPTILSTDALRSDKMSARWQDSFSRPACVNDLGSVFVAPDPMGVRDLMMPPFAMGGENTAMLYINRRHPALEGVAIDYTWHPDRVERRCRFEGFEVLSVTRAATAQQPAVLIHLRVTNPGGETREAEIEVKVAGRAIHTVDGWDKGQLSIDHLTGHPESWRFDGSLGAMCFESAALAFSVQGTRPTPHAVENKALLYDVRLKPGESWELCFVLAMGESPDAAARCFLSLADNFGAACASVRDTWNARLVAAFTPGNDVFSGHLPVLWTDDKDLERLYYMGVVGGTLCSRRDNPLARVAPTYVTLTGDYWPTACFLWDTMISDGCWAMLDPEALRRLIEAWIEIDLGRHHALDSITGRGVGNWYAVNDTALVRMAHTYVRHTGDMAWLDKVVAGRSVIDRLQAHALRWRELDTNGHGLADCGNGWNCGDGLTTWIHETAGFNAAWVAAQRQAAELREARGEPVAAERLRDGARDLLRGVMGLYAEGAGFWHAKYPDGSAVPVRLLYDFVAASDCIADDLTADMRREMIAFFLRELKTEAWVRALSDWDDDAVRSFRPDWAWTGAYGAFPAMSVAALRRLGCNEPWIVEWLRKVALAACQGPIGQCHVVEPLGDAPRGGARKSPIGGWTVNATAAFPAVFAEHVFGVRATLRDGLRWTGYLTGMDRDAVLENVPFQGTNYRVTARGADVMACMKISGNLAGL